jgi:5-methylcytosine-specific restriction enzyme A
MCLERGRFTPAAVVDHIVPIAQAPELRLNLANLRSLCKRCHDAHTARTQGFASGRKEGVDKKSDGSKP